MPSISLKKLGQSVLDLLFPIQCLICGKDGIFLCNDCANNLPKVANQICIVCQKPSPFGKTHPECVSDSCVDGLITAVSYKHPDVKKIIEVFKYSFVSSLSTSLASLLFAEIEKQNLADYFADFVIIPVPLHKRRFAWRGFNQSELLSQALSEKLNTTFDPNHVMRTKYTKPQTKLKAYERKLNIKDAFSIKFAIHDSRLLLVDDVVTSGATINELAQILKKAGAKEVWAAAVA